MVESQALAALPQQDHLAVLIVKENDTVESIRWQAWLGASVNLNAKEKSLGSLSIGVPCNQSTGIDQRVEIAHGTAAEHSLGAPILRQFLG